jgi:hypothetical protein
VKPCIKLMALPTRANISCLMFREPARSYISVEFLWR